MISNDSALRKAFMVANYFFLAITGVACIFPMLHILALSFSSEAAIEASQVVIWPIGFQTNTYQYVMGQPQFFKAFLISLQRTGIGLVVNMLLTVLTAYPISLSKKKFKARQFYAWFFVVTTLFNGGLIPGYLVVKETGLLNNIWALILPSAVPVFNIILMQNFLKELPDEISEAAFIDGAGHFGVLWRILLPISKPILATLVLFVAVAHWNAWFDGMIFMKDSTNYPLQTFLQAIVVKKDLTVTSDIRQMLNVSEKNARAAQIIVAMIPILCIYPFLQKYFTKGIIMGSVKG